MKFINKGKSKVATFVALIATVLCAVIAAFTGLFGGFGAGVQTADALGTGYSYNLGTYNSLDSTAIRSFMGRIMGYSSQKSYNELSLALDIDSDHIKNRAEMDTQVTFGGQVWNVVYVSKTKGGDVIATLWLAAGSDVKTWSTWYGDASNTWATPSNMYSTSLIRHFLVGSPYRDKTQGMVVTDESRLDWGSTESQSSTWKTFIQLYGKFIATPSEVSWQENQGISGATMTANNEAYGTHEAPNFSKGYDYSLKDGYNNWMYDKLWLPSAYETSYGNGASVQGNLWNVNNTVRQANTNGTGYGTFLRSGSGSDATKAYYISADGSSTSAYQVTNSGYVRPALHLNLKALAQAAGLFIDKPTLATNSLYFSSSAQSFSLSSVTNMSVTLPYTWTRSGIWVSVPAGAAMGTYNIVVTPSSGYCWSDGSAGTYSLPITINSYGTVTLPTLSKQSATFSTTSQTFTVTGIGNVSMNIPAGWSTDGKGNITIPANTLPGQYDLVFVPDNGYTWQGGGTGAKIVNFTITATAIATPTLSKTSTTFSAAAQTFTISAVDNMTITLPNGWTRSGTTITIPAYAHVGQYEVVVTPNTGYVWQGGGTGAKVLPITVTAGSLATPTLSKTSTAFSTAAQTFTISAVDNMTVTLPNGWTRNGTTITIPANTLPGQYDVIVTPNTGYDWRGGGTGSKVLPIAITATSIAVPALSKTSTAYSAAAQTITMDTYSFDISAMRVTLPNGWTRSDKTITIPAGTLPGQYEVIVTPEAGYVWQGGGTGAKVLPIAITYHTATMPALSKTSTAYSTAAQTFTVGTAAPVGVVYALPNGWTLNSYTVTIPAGTAVGTYTITATVIKGYAFSDGIAVRSYSMVITPATISEITWSSTATSFEYTASPITLSASAAGAGVLPVIVTGDNVNAGTFTVTAVNVNPNYTFASTLATSKTITITKQKITAVDWSVTANSGFEYDTQNHAPTASFTATNGKVYSLPVTMEKDGESVTSAINAGSYTATVAAGTYNINFSLEKDSTVNFTVNPREIQIDWGTDTFTYTGSNCDTAVTLAVASGLLGSDTLTLTATYKSGDRLNVSDSGFVMEAGIEEEASNYKLPSVITHIYKIAPLTLSEVTAEVQGTYTYNGSIQTPEVSLSGGNIVDGDTVGTFVSGGGIDAGTYSATVIGINNPNYLLDGTISVQFTISPLDITDIKWSVADGEEFTYNGANHAPEAWFVYNGVTYALPVDLAEAYNASEDYYVSNVTAGVFRNNFNLVDNGEEEESGYAASVSFLINKAKITANDVDWSFTEGFKFAPGYDPSVSALFRFNNVSYLLTLGFEDADGEAVEIGGDGTQWVTGVYKATVSLGEGDEYGNFVLEGVISRTFKITESAAGKYTVVWEGFSSVINYNGASQTPNAYIIVDGEKLGVTVSVEKLGADGEWVTASEAKNAGTYRFTATKAHYVLDNYTVTCRIDPRVISVSYKNLTGLTHGSVVNVTATTTDPVASAEITAGILNLAVSGSGHVAGTHVVRVEAQVEDSQGNKVKTDNYVISNATAVQTIGKKLLSFDDIDWKLEFVYNGGIKIPEGRVKTNVLTENDKAAGAYVIFEFVYATNVGEYKVKVLGISNENYTYAGEVELVIKELEVTEVKWEGVQDGNSVTYNKLNQMPKPYIEVGGEKIYLTGTLEKYDDVNEEWYEAAYAINAGNFRFTTDEIAQGTGNYFVASAVNNFTIDRYELSAIYLTRNVFTYDGNSPEIEVYAIGANNERIVITNFIVLDKLGVTVADYANAGNYIVQAQMGVLGDNSNYTLRELKVTTFIINPQTVSVTFEITDNNWSWKADVETVPTVTVRVSAPNAVEVRYGKMGADVNNAVSYNNGLTFTFNITGVTGDGVISVHAASANYQITGSSVQTFNIIPIDGEAQATFSFEGDAWFDDNMELVYGETGGLSIDVTADSDVEINYYKDGVLLDEPITSIDGLDAGTYLITVNCPTRELSTNIASASRTFIILPKEVDFTGVEWVIDGNKIAGDSVKYSGKMYNATLNLGDLSDDFEVYYTNGSLKDSGSITTIATIIPKSANYKATNVTATYTWTIEPGEDETSTMWILVVVICVLAVLFILCAYVAAKRKRVTTGDDDGFYDDVSEDDMQ